MYARALRDLIERDTPRIVTFIRELLFEAGSSLMANSISRMDPRSGKFRAGQEHARAKLTETQVKVIRLKKRAGLTLEKLARQYSISAMNVSHICNYQSWKHVE